MKNIKIMLIIILIVFLGVILLYRGANTNSQYKFKEGMGTDTDTSTDTTTDTTTVTTTDTTTDTDTGTLSAGEVAQKAATDITSSIDSILTQAGIPIPGETEELTSIFKQLKNLIVSEAEFNNKGDEATLMKDKEMPTANTVVPSITDMSFFRGVNFSDSFCELYDKINKTELNNKCSTLTAESCNSVDCCILVDGNKCVAGNKEGPYMVSDKYTDYNYYLHKYQCYGSCHDNEY